MTDNDTVDHVSRRSVLRTSAVATGTLVGSGPGIGTVAGTTQEGETFLEAFDGGFPVVVVRGDSFVDRRGPTPHPLFQDAAIEDLEGIVAFVPRRLADEEGRVGLKDMLVMMSEQVLEGDLTTATDAALFSGRQWFPERVAEIVDGIGRPAYIAEEGLAATRVLAFGGEEWVQRDDVMIGWTPDAWFPEGYEGPEHTDVVEAGTSLEEPDGSLFLFAAAGHNFFAVEEESEYGKSLAEIRQRGVLWEELVEAETATVLEL